MQTPGYIAHDKGEISIDYVRTFKTPEAFLKAHPELSEEIWNNAQPEETKKVVKIRKTSEKESQE